MSHPRGGVDGLALIQCLPLGIHEFRPFPGTMVDKPQLVPRHPTAICALQGCPRIRKSMKCKTRTKKPACDSSSPRTSTLLYHHHDEVFGTEEASFLAEAQAVRWNLR